MIGALPLAALCQQIETAAASDAAVLAGMGEKFAAEAQCTLTEIDAIGCNPD